MAEKDAYASWQLSAQEVERILQCYTVDSFDDYQRMDEADLREIVSLFRAMGPSK